MMADAPRYRCWQRLLFCFAIFAFVWVAYKDVRVLDRMTHYDNFWYVPTAMSLMEDGDFDLSEWQGRIESLDPGRKTLR